MTTGFSSNYGYAAAQALRGRRLILDGATYNNKDWITAQNGTWDKKAKHWSIPIPGSNKACSDLLYGITSRGMQWKAAG